MIVLSALQVAAAHETVLPTSYPETKMGLDSPESGGRQDGDMVMMAISSCGRLSGHLFCPQTWVGRDNGTAAGAAVRKKSLHIRTHDADVGLVLTHDNPRYVDRTGSHALR